MESPKLTEGSTEVQTENKNISEDLQGNEISS